MSKEQKLHGALFPQTVYIKNPPSAITIRKRAIELLGCEYKVMTCERMDYRQADYTLWVDISERESDKHQLREYLIEAIRRLKQDGRIEIWETHDLFNSIIIRKKYGVRSACIPLNALRWNIPQRVSYPKP